MMMMMMNVLHYLIKRDDDEKKLPEYVNIKDKICSGSVAYVINREGMKNILWEWMRC